MDLPDKYIGTSINISGDWIWYRLHLKWEWSSSKASRQPTPKWLRQLPNKFKPIKWEWSWERRELWPSTASLTSTASSTTRSHSSWMRSSLSTSAISLSSIRISVQLHLILQMPIILLKFAMPPVTITRISPCQQKPFSNSPIATRCSFNLCAIGLSGPIFFWNLDLSLIFGAC